VPGYAIYIPNKTGAAPEHLDDVGLSILRRDRCPEFADVLANAPDGGRGIIGCWRTLSDNGGFNPKDYTWTPAKADKARGLPAKRFYIGIPACGIRPQDIERKQTYRGYAIPLADGYRWSIPPAVSLPHKHGLDEEGSPVRVIEDAWRGYWDRSEKFAIEFFAAVDRLNSGATETQFTLADAWAFSCEALSLNYRLSPEIVDALGLLNDDGMRNIIKAAIDLPVLIDAENQKKTETLTIPVG
jgi:hypothetical protein